MPVKAEELLVTSMGDHVYRYEKSIVAFFNGPRKVLSTSIYNGGYHEDLTSIFNHDCTIAPGMPCEMLAPTYEGHMRIIAKKLGLDQKKSSGIGTAASMDNAAMVKLAYKELTVTAVVTGGIEHNAGRVGDPADYYKPEEKPLKPGTINIMLFLDSDMSPGTLTRALVTCTEAKIAAIQELMEGSCYSTGLATGSGTDQTIIVANAASCLYLEGAGKHTKLGELIGKAVKKAVQKALYKQTGLSAKLQHNALRRLRRFGCTVDTIWNIYLGTRKDPLIKPRFVEKLEEIAKDDAVVTLVSLYVHLLDQYAWKLLSAKETANGCQILLKLLAKQIGVSKYVKWQKFSASAAIHVLANLLAMALPDAK